MSRRRDDTATEGFDPAVAAWFLVMSEEPDAETIAAFAAWREENPALAAQYDRAHRLWSLLGRMPSDRSARIIPLRPFDDVFDERAVPPASVRPSRGRVFAAAAMAAAAALAVVLVPTALVERKPDKVATETAVNRTIALDDGSVIELGAASAVRIAYSPSERRVMLDSGEAFFEVAKDASRPFVVEAGGASVTALGTKFNVGLTHEDVTVTLLEGRVAVDEADAEPSDAPASPSPVGEVAPERPAPVMLSPGEQVRFAKAERKLLPIAVVDAPRVAAWRERKLVFDGAPLSQALEQVNRYLHEPILLSDPRLGELPVYGVFNAGDSSGIVSALERAFPVRARTVPGRGTVLAPATNGQKSL
jgi:transmembrane sensor